MNYVIGIDGGGTKTAAVVLDEDGHLLGRGEGGPSTYGVVPPEVTRASILTAAQMAAQSAGLLEAHFSAAFAGLGNVVSDLDRTALHEMIAAMYLAGSAHIGVDHDCRVALAGGLATRHGLVMIAGTGTSCFGMNAAGQGWRSGGWGPLIDDEGSSYWLGIQAMRATVLAYDGRGPATLLSDIVMERLALREVEEVMNRLYAAEMTRTEIASLAPVIFQAAHAGDAVAAKLIQLGCEAMADCALAVARRLSLDTGSSELALVGGLTNAGDALFAPFTAAIHDRLPHCAVLTAEFPPAVGAGLLALQLIHHPIDETVLVTLRQSISLQRVNE